MVYGIVSEFNPFHNGHKLLIDKVKTAENTVVSVTSSTFVQRGDISIINKIDKTKGALKNGVDLVLELPAVYSLTSGEAFGKSAVEILKATNVIDKLLFGSECGQVKLLEKAVSIFENQQLQSKIRQYMQKGEYYPKAVYNSVAELYDKETAELFNGANNILGIEYIRALKGSTIEPVTFPREGAGHHSNTAVEGIASGSYIREHFSEKELLTPDYQITDTAKIENLEKLIIYKFSEMSKKEIQCLPDVIEGFENRIIQGIKSNNSFTELCYSLKTKRYTMARIRRILCCGLLGITKEIQSTPVPYIRILGFNDKGMALLKDIKKNSTLPLITNLKEGYDKLNDNGKKIMDIEILATRLWSLGSNNNTLLKNDFQQEILHTIS
jgi:predicted nucleotidyltransferase